MIFANVAELPTNADGAPFDVDGALVAAGLDWPVSRRKVYMRSSRAAVTPDVEVPGMVAVTRGDQPDAAVFQIASGRYQPHQNREIVQFFADYASAAGTQLTRLGSLKDGALVFGQAPLPNGEFEVSPGDVVRGMLTIGTSHDGSVSTHVKYAATRIICQNTFRMAIAERGQRSYTVRHTRRFDASERNRAARALGLATEQNARFAETARALHRARFDERARLEFVTRLTNPKLLADVIAVSQPMATDGASALDSILNAGTADVRVKRAHELTREDLTRQGAAILAAIMNGTGSEPDTAWGAFNGVTYWADHEAGRRANGRDAALVSAQFGANADMKESALEILVSMTGTARA